jgi:DNA-binding SARP family transcriptional activator
MGHKLFPALTFLPFKEKKTAMNDHGILNSDHRFAKWLLEAAPILNEKYPGILKSIRSAVLAHSFQHINQNLQRLLTLHAEVRPPKGVFLSETDVVVR